MIYTPTNYRMTVASLLDMAMVLDVPFLSIIEVNGIITKKMVTISMQINPRDRSGFFSISKNLPTHRILNPVNKTPFITKPLKQNNNIQMDVK